MNTHRLKALLIWGLLCAGLHGNADTGDSILTTRFCSEPHYHPHSTEAGTRHGDCTATKWQGQALSTGSQAEEFVLHSGKLPVITIPVTSLWKAHAQGTREGRTSS